MLKTYKVQLFAACISGVIAIVLCNLWIQPYKFKETRFQNIDSTNRSLFYEDLNGNGEAEIIEQGININVSNIHVNSDRSFAEQGNLKGDWVEAVKPFTGDFNSNGLKEVYGLTMVSDSVYISAFEYGSYERPVFERFLITTEAELGDISYSFPGRFYDFTGDGFDELILTLGAGYAIDPRTLFVIDIVNDSAWHTPLDWGAIFHLYDIQDFDHDGNPDILTASRTPRNVHSDDYVFGDKISYFFVFDPQLDTIYSPFNIPGTSPVFYATIGDNAYVYNVKRTTEEPTRFYKWDSGWNEVEIPEIIRDCRVYINRELIWEEKQLMILFDNHTESYKSYFVNQEFELEETPKQLKYAVPLIEDVTGDKIDDILTYQDGELILYSGKSWMKSSLKFLEQIDKMSAGFRFGEYKLLVDTYNRRYYFDIVKNPVFQWVWLFCLSVAITFFLLTNFIIKFRKYRQESVSRKLDLLQLKTVKNHVDPHFTVNILSSIRMLLVRNDFLRAEEHFDQYVKLIRHNLVNADSIQSTIGEECRLAQTYLSLERFRLKEKFDFKVNCEPQFSNLALPKMLIQTHVENAVKHGIFHLEGRVGLITLDIDDENGRPIVWVRDNGIGRALAREIGSINTGKGMGITAKIIKLYNTLEKANIKQQIIDLDQGTLVKILL